MRGALLAGLVLVVSGRAVVALEPQRLAPTVGKVWVLATLPDEPDTVLAGTWFGVVRSDDGGDTWRVVGGEGQFIASLAVAPSDPQRVYAGISPNRGVEDDEGGVLVSDDGGRSFRPANAGLEYSPNPWRPQRYQFVDDLSVDPGDPDRAWAATRRGLFLTSDGGRQWLLASTERSPTVLATREAGAPVVYLGGTGVLRSTDLGGIFADFSAGLSRNHGNHLDPLRVDDLIALPEADGALLGRSWERELVRRERGSEAWQWVLLRQPAGFTSVGAAPPGSHGVWATSTWAGLFFSADGGQEWQKVEADELVCARDGARSFYHPTTAVAVLPGDGSRVVVADYQGVQLSSDRGVSWRRPIPGLAAARVASVWVDPEQPRRLLFATLGDGLHLSTDSGLTSTEVLSSTLDPCHIPSPNPFSQPPRECWWWYEIIPTARRTLIVRGDCGAYESSDRGTSWREIDEHERWPVGRAFDGSISYETRGASLWRKGVNVARWVRCGDLPVVNGVSPQVVGVAVHPDTPSVAVVGTNCGLLRSSDGCRSWEVVGVPNDWSNHLWWSCEPMVAPWDPQHYLVATIGCGPNRTSRDTGRTWFEEGLPSSWWQESVVIDPERVGTLYAVLGSGEVVVSRDAGLTWETLSDDLADVEWVSDVTLHPDGDHLLVSIPYAGAAYLIDVRTQEQAVVAGGTLPDHD